MRVLVLAFLFVILAETHVQAEQRYALLIGNQDYPASVGPLTNPHQDVSLISESLRRSGFDDIVVLKDGNQAEIYAALSAFVGKLSAAGDEGVGFFYYSGHGGSAESSGVRQNYLIPAKTPLTTAAQLPLMGVSLGSIVESLSAANAKAVFIVSDACRNTLPFTSSKGGTTDRSFVPIQTRSGLFIAYATADGATAPDDGLFARALATHIPSPGQTATRAFELAFRDVARSRAGNRLPFYSPGLLEDICFNGCLGGSVVEAPKLLEPIAESSTSSRSDRGMDQPVSATMAAMIEDVRNRPRTQPQTSPTLNVEARPDQLDIGDTVQDCELCPEMVVLPPGQVRLAPSAHLVDINYEFAVGKYEVTWDEWDACVEQGGCPGNMERKRSFGMTGGDEGWGKGRRPVIHISWDEAQTYVAWLSEVTGHKYRLPSYSEWEYAARAGSADTFSWGAAMPVCETGVENSANFNDQRRCREQGTTPVGFSSPNIFGVFDVVGNVSEWVQDCYESDITLYPDDGSSLPRAACRNRVFRGGSWQSGITDLASQHGAPYSEGWGSGFRVVTELSK
ncbi:MAG: SUMF1/EgtB/PvdO family nonheme iron enzyme [Pseudomonadota bacterium]